MWYGVLPLSSLYVLSTLLYMTEHLSVIISEADVHDYHGKRNIIKPQV